MRKNIVRIPPPLEILPAERERPTGLLDHVSFCLGQVCAEDAEAMKLANTVDTTDSQTGGFKEDRLFLARAIKLWAGEHGYNDVAAAKERAIRNKLEWALRRRDTAELPVSRRARIALAAAKEANGQIENGG
jgi:hypothetical protein